MSKPWFLSPATPAHPVQRGAAAVGMLIDLPALEQGAVLMLRHWCDGEAGRISVAEDFSLSLGPSRGAEAVNALAHLVTLFARHGRRPLMRHGVTCSCLGGDESAFAQMVASAAQGDREDAMAFALTMMPADTAYEAVQMAEPLGLAIQSMALNLRHIFPTPQTRRH